MSCDVILALKQMKVFVMWLVESWFSFEQKAVVLSQVMQFLKNYF